MALFQSLSNRPMVACHRHDILYVNPSIECKIKNEELTLNQLT